MNSNEENRYGLGNRLCLDFANLSASPGELLEQSPGWDGLLDFLEFKDIISAQQTSHLRRLPQTDVKAATSLLRHSEELGRALRLIFKAMLTGQAPQPHWLEPVNRILRVTEGHDELLWDGNAWRLGFVAREEGLDWFLAAIARSGAELIAEGPNDKLRQCSNPQCPMFFYDDSRTRRRRWCSMALCGNRAKVAAFARRHVEEARAHHA